ncbi:MAG: phenylacetate--CoA ligase [Candidatus Poribacteria bacterium]|nr:phenylacetate--CoA ligase [Candidatus Poribacteria bacterium]
MDLQALQLKKLKWQVERCYRQSEFYRERFDAAGTSPADVKTLDDLRRFPFVHKEELREEQRRHPFWGRFTVAPATEFREVHPSTGTTGTPVNTIWSATDVDYITEITARTLWSIGVRSEDILQNAFAYGLWVAGLAVHYACADIGCLVIPIGAALTERQIDYMVRLKSTVLIATPSYAVYLSEQLKAHGYGTADLNLRIGCFGGEPGTEVPATRRAIEDGLGIDAFDYYGLAEIGPTFASECSEKTGLHWSEDLHLVEVIHPETKEPVPEGELGILVITHLERSATPMIRYWTNDLVRLDTAPCPCGRTHARSPGGILGRADDMIIFMGVNFYPMQVEQVVRSFEALSSEYRIRLAHDASRHRDTCTILVELEQEGMSQEQALKLHESIVGALQETLVFRPEVEFVPRGTLERTTFKAKRVIETRRAFAREP